MQHPALSDQLLDRAGDVFDRNVRVDAMLVQQKVACLIRVPTPSEAVSPDGSDMEITGVDDLVEAVGDETCCRHAEKPTAQPSRLCSERAE